MNAQELKWVVIGGGVILLFFIAIIMLVNESNFATACIEAGHNLIGEDCVAP